MKRLLALLLIATSCERVTPSGEQGSTCADTIDNDNDGLIDCEEPACNFEPNCLCGNTFVDAGELCDDGNNLDGDGCSSDCTGLEVCGDNTLNAGELCDDGNTTSGDGCSSDCLSVEICGNGIVDAAAGELCDDGNNLDNDGCSSDCTGLEVCGDNTLNAGELCDDGNTTSGDGCRADCNKLEVCGDNIVDAGEGCDDGGVSAGDGCSSSCAEEPRFSCTGTPSICNEAPIAINDSVSVNEDTAGSFSVATLLANDTDRENDALSILSVQSAVNGVVSFTPGAANVAFTPSLNFTGTASFEYTVRDAQGTDVGLVTVSVLAINDAPVNSVPTSAQETFQQTAKVFSSANSNRITISDIDAATNPVQVTLDASNGAVTLGGLAGLSFSAGDGVADASTTFTGTLSSINAALNGVSLLPNAAFLGTATLTITTNDQGNTGSGGARSDTDTISITVNSGVATQLAAGLEHTCGLTLEGAVFCWGRNQLGQIGNNGAFVIPTPSQVAGGEQGGAFLSNVTQIAAGFDHTCAVIDDGSLFCWGDNGADQLGNGSSAFNSGRTPTQVLGVGGAGSLSNVAQVTAGDNHTCALTSAGNVFCWGVDSAGALGNGNSGSSETPTQVRGVGGVGFLSNIAQISAGDDFNCAVSTAGSVFCWGRDGFGMLGNGAGSGNSSETPTQVLGVGGVGFLSNIAQVSTGADHTCAVTNNGASFCWGSNFKGQLGNGGLVNGQTPTQVVAGEQGGAFLSNVTQIATGFDHTCAVTSAGASFCWGNNFSGQLGNGGGGSGDANETPTQVLGVGGVGFLLEVAEVSLGSSHSCALSNAGAVFCWGNGGAGVLGNGVNTSNTPTSVSAF